MNWAFGRSVSRTHVFLFQWTADGDNGADGHLARRHVEEAFRPKLGGFINMRKMVEGHVWERHSKIDVATKSLAEQRRQDQKA